MSFDVDSAKSDHLSPAEAPADRQAAGSAKPLGRGLADVSHLFLSSKAAPPRQDHAGERATDQELARPELRKGTAVLRPRDGLTKQLLSATLQECQTALERALRAVDTDIPCSAGGAIDVLALDGDNQPVVIDIETGAAGDALLVRGLDHLDWVRHNAGSLRRTYPAWVMQGSGRTRLFLVARHFPAHLRRAVRQIGAPGVACFTYRGVELSGRVGVFFEPVRLDED